MAHKILIIEDENILREILRDSLKKEGYKVYTASDGEEGLEKMNSVKPNLVILDVIMPKMDGFEVMRRMSKDENLSKVRVIVISNSGQPVEIEEAMKLGAKDFIIKTEFDQKGLIEKVKKQLEGK